MREKCMFYDMYFDEIRQLSDEQWELFAKDFFCTMGYQILLPPSRGADGGKDLIITQAGKGFLVSCKHFINSGKCVGKSDENDIYDRLSRYNCDGFIGFYSTNITTYFQSYIEDMRLKGINIKIFSYNDIIEYIDRMPHHILQKYFSRPYNFSLQTNTPEYIPLLCQICNKKDILLEENICNSAIYLFNIDNKICMTYGCKSCLNALNKIDIGWVELHQLRFHDQFLNWDNYIQELLKKYSPHETFFETYYKMSQGIRQISIPQGWGGWF